MTLDVVAGAETADDGALEAPEGNTKIQGRGPWKLAFERLRADKAAIISFIVIVLIVAMAVFAFVFPSITGHGQFKQYRDTGLSVDGIPVGPNGEFWFGTDLVGRDVLVRIAYGARISLSVGVLVTLIIVGIGTIVGLAAGFFGKIVDTVIARIIDVMLSIPFLLFAISLASLYGAGFWVVVFVLSVFGWSSIARIVRGQVLSIREREYVEAARAMGAGSMRIMLIDIFPNVLAPVIVYTTLLIPAAIVGEASLSFLGVGIQAPTSDWGRMISEASQAYSFAPHYLIFPSIFLLITTLAFNILGDGVRDAFDPRGDRMFG